MVLVFVAACKERRRLKPAIPDVGRQPDVAPVMLNKELPFRIHLHSTLRKSGNVTLRIFIDREGRS